MQARSCILVASSPEILCRVDQQREVTNRPLAGTRRRGATEEEDRGLEADLLADSKERAEHIMLVDLGRNDVGRVAEAGSVKVEKLMEVERYSHVMHISSTVKGAGLALRSVCFVPVHALCVVVCSVRIHRLLSWARQLFYKRSAQGISTCESQEFSRGCEVAVRVCR